MHRPVPVDVQQQEGAHHALVLELYGCRQLLCHQLCSLLAQQHRLSRRGRWEVNKHRIGLGIDNLQQAAGQTDYVENSVLWKGDADAVFVSFAHMHDKLLALHRQLQVLCTARAATVQGPSLQLQLTVSYGADAAATDTGRARPYTPWLLLPWVPAACPPQPC